MRHEFKPGDLALIVGASVPENIGKVVTLIRRDCNAIINMPETGYVFRNPMKLPAWVVEGDLIGLRYGPTKIGAIHESRLMPLKGDEQPAQVRQAERVS